MIKIIALAAFVVAISSAPAQAQITVIDPANLKVQVVHQVEFVRTVAQLLAIYQEAKQQYELARMQAQNVKTMPSMFPQTILSRLYLLNPSRACISCGGWTAAANTGGDPGATFGGVTATLGDVGQVLSRMSPEAQASFQARLANSVYLPDAAVRSDLAALAQARQNDPKMQQYVAQCRSVAAGDTFTSQVQVTQAGAACAAVQAQQTANTNALLSRMVEDASIRKAKEIDAETGRVNTQIEHAKAAAEVKQQTAGTDEAIRQMYRDLER